MVTGGIVCLLMAIAFFALTLVYVCIKAELSEQKEKLMEAEIKIERLENDLLNIKTDINYILIEFNKGITDIVTNIREE